MSFNREEIDEVGYWNIEEIKNAMGKGILSDNFESEIMKYIESLKANGGSF